MKITKNLTEGNVYRNMLAFALPCLFAALLRQAYTTVDAVIAGKCISEYALGAVSCTDSFSGTLFSLFNGFAAGFGIYISHLFGRKDHAALKRDTVHMIGIVGAVSVLFSILIILFRTPILDYLQIDPLLREDAEIYFIVYSAGHLFTFVNPLISGVLGSLGIAKVSLYTTLVSSVVNLGGNLFTVLVLRMGVAGLALSTVASVAGTVLVQVITLRLAFRELEGKPASYRFSFAGFRRSFRYTFPGAIQQLAFHGVGFFIGPIVNGISAAATTGYNVSVRLYSICSQTIWVAGSAFATYIAQSVGVGNFGKIRKGVKAGFVINILLLLPFVLSVWLFARPIVTLFFPEGYAGETFEYAVRYAKIFLPFLYVQLVGHLYHSYLRSLGCISTVFWISLFGSVVRLIFTYRLTPTWGLDGVYAAQVISWIADMIVSFVIYYFFNRTEKQVMGRVRRVLN